MSQPNELSPELTAFIHDLLEGKRISDAKTEPRSVGVMSRMTAIYIVEDAKKGLINLGSDLDIEVKSDTESLIGFLCGESNSWRWHTSYMRGVAERALETDMSVTSLYKLDQPGPNQAIDLFHTNESNRGNVFLECVCNGVKIGKSELDWSTAKYLRLTSVEVDEFRASSKGSFSFNTQYRSL